MGSEDGSNPPTETNVTRKEEEKEELASNFEPLGEEAAQDFDSNLPKTVSLLHGPNGSKLYLVGTAHFSLESQEDVSNVIRAVRPHIVVVELCRARSGILRMDEKTLQEEASNLTFSNMKEIIKSNGFLQGIMHILLLSVSAQLTRDLGMPPGGEFRRAFEEVKNIPGCMFHFGDRPMHITLNRALARLSWWQRIWVAYKVLIENQKLTKDDVEHFKQSDLLDSALKNISAEFPEIGKVFVEERDIYLTFSLQTAVKSPFCNIYNELEPTIAVGVVGIGHTPGIKELWMKVSDEDVQPLLVVEEKKKRGIYKKTLGLCVVLFIGYKMRNRIKLHSAFNHIMTWIK